MARRLSEESWVEIRTKYEMGVPMLQIAGDFDITEGAIRARRNKEGWTQKLRTQIIELKEKVQEITNNITDSQIPYVQDEINDMLSLQREVNTFVKRAVKLNTMNLDAVLNEPDHEKRINMTARMKATMPDLASITTNRPAITPPQPDEDEKDDSVIRFYLPERH